MSGFYGKCFKHHGTRKVLGHIFFGRGELRNCANSGLPKEILKLPPASSNYFKKYCSFHTRSYDPHNRLCPRLDIKRFKGTNTNNRVEYSRNCLSRKDTLMVPVLMGSATIGGSNKDPQSNCNQISDWLQSMRKYLKNSVTLYAASDDGIPDINALAKDISDHGIKKIEEAQKVLQQKLKKIRADMLKAGNDLEKEVLKLSIAALEEAIDELEDVKRQIKKELRNAKKRK